MKTRNKHQMHYGRAVMLAAALLLPASLVRAQSAGQWETPARIYDKVCVYCHETTVAPPLLGRNLEPDYVRLVVLSGLRAMPAFRPTDFSEDELIALGRFVQTQPARRSSQPQRTPTSADRVPGNQP